MDHQTLATIKKDIKHYAYHSFHYVDWDELSSYKLMFKSEEGLYVHGFRKDHQMDELLWATNDCNHLIKYALTFKNTLLSFIPKPWQEQLKQAGLIEYGVIRDYWLHDISRYKNNPQLQCLSLFDAQNISDVTKDCLMVSREFHGESKDDVEAWLSGKDYHLQSIQAKDIAIMGYHVDQELVGVVFVAIYGHQSEKGPILWLREIAVKRAYQGKGIGRMLLENAIAYGYHHGAKRSFLAADDLNRGAIHLYTSLGYQPHQEDEQIDFITP